MEMPATVRLRGGRVERLTTSSRPGPGPVGGHGSGSVAGRTQPSAGPRGPAALLPESRGLEAQEAEAHLLLRSPCSPTVLLTVGRERPLTGTLSGLALTCSWSRGNGCAPTPPVRQFP